MYTVIYRRTLIGNNFQGDMQQVEPSSIITQHCDSFEEARLYLHGQLNEIKPYEKPAFHFSYSIEDGSEYEGKELLIHASVSKEVTNGLVVNLKTVVEIYEEVYIIKGYI